MIKQRIIEFLDKYNLCDKTIVVGFSGGYDSMCLVDVLSHIKKTEGFDNLKIITAHFNHNWRGEEALKEQEICRLFSASKGFDFFTKTAPAGMKKNENDARIARYDFFEEAIENYDADAVFTAHNKDDNAETVLYRVIKGTGLHGLKSISERRNYFYRPLLKTTRAEIMEYCEKHNLSPNKDSSNNDTKYRRNFIRLNVIPMLEKINPSVKDSLNTLAEVATSENAIIEEYLDSIKKTIYNGDSIISSEYNKLSKPVQKRIIHEFLQSLDLDYDFKKINEICDFIELNISKRNGSTISLASALWLYVDDKIIETIPKKASFSTITQKIEPVEIVSEGDYKIGNRTLTLKKFIENDVFVFPDSTANFVYVDLSDIKLPLTVRTRNDGDVINPFGMSGTMKLKKYLNSKGVNRHKRDELILVTQGNEVLWVAEVGLSNKIGVTVTPTHIIEIK